MYLCCNIVDLYLWLQFFLFYSGLFGLHIPMVLAALAGHGVRDGQLDCVLDLQHAIVSVDPLEEISGDIRDNRRCPDPSVSDVQIGIF